MIGHLSRVRGTLVLLAAALPLLPSGIAAQSNGQGFLFEQPVIQVGVNVGYARAHAGGPVLGRAIEDFTLDKRDFDAPAWGVQFALRTMERLDVALDVRFSRSQTRSESRPYLGTDGLPIEQTTTFMRVPVTLSAKYFLRDRGRAVSRFAWIPQKWVPFVGVGAGLSWYQLKQEGEFVEEPSLDILNLTIESSSAAPSVHAMAGVDISMSPRFLWTLEARYSLGGDRMDYAFDYKNLDLSGFQATIGISARF